jgi:hypothetical protein
MDIGFSTWLDIGWGIIEVALIIIGGLAPFVGGFILGPQFFAGRYFVVITGILGIMTFSVACWGLALWLAEVVACAA